jgi:DNA polymerase-1
MPRRLYLIDCAYHFRAAFFVLPQMFSRDRRLVNAVYGFLSVLLKVASKYRPDALAVAGDAPAPYFRHGLFPAYKSTKTRVPDECDQQMPILLEVLEAMRIPYLTGQGFEADDVIATVSESAQKRGYFVWVCSRDKDLLQLVNESVRVLDISSGDEVTAGRVVRERGVRPEQVPDAIALAGDTADGLPGVPGVGWKTAARLLADYGSVEGILDHWEVVGGRLGRDVHDLQQQVLLAKRLALLRRDVPVVGGPEDWTLRRPDVRRLAPLFHQLGFERLLERIESLAWPAPAGPEE